MRGLGRTVLISLAAYLLIKIVSKGSAAKNLLVSFANISYAFEGTALILIINISVKNAAAEIIKLNSVQGNIYFNGSHIGIAENNYQVIIGSQKETIIPFRVRVMVTSVIDQLVKIFTGQLRGQAMLNFKGTANVEGLPIPVDINYSLV